ncbi:MAG: response regulator [Oligoflexales bacterium]|nr:response regulator [Oligoflexales bacterium]
MRTIQELKILAVDDEPDLLDLLEYELTAMGSHVYKAGNTQIAFEILEEHHVDLIISDIRMPNGGGLEFLDRVQRTPLKSVPIFVLMSAFYDLALEDVYDRGASAVLGKPFYRKDLVSILQTLTVPPEQRWVQRGDMSAEAPVLRIQSSFQSLEQAKADGLLSLGRGGMFLASHQKTELPPVSMPIDFQIHFAEGELKKLRGRGVIRWIRRKKESDFLNAVGLEFLFLDSSSLAAVLAYLQKVQPVPFIPKC